MAKSRSLPEFVLRVHTYAELGRYAKAFAEGFLNLLILCGAAGLGKSWHVRDALGGRAAWVDGNATAFGVYLHAYEHLDEPIVLDDVDGLPRDRNGVRLLKALCQTEKTKSLSWESDARTLERRGVPKQFTTTSRVAIIANEWRTINGDVAALEDRGHFILFEPTALEVHLQAAVWFWDQEIFDVVADHLHLTSRHSLRTYVLAWEQKQAGLDWRQVVLSRYLSGTAVTVAKLTADPTIPSEQERVRLFVESGAGCRATYFNIAKKLQPQERPPEIKLSHSTPPAEKGPGQSVLDRLRRQFGELGEG